MAARDVRYFEFLRDAIIQKFRNPGLPSFRSIPYGPQNDKTSVFGRIYTTFRELIPKGFNLYQYLNISERPVLENLYRNLTSDINLKFLNDPKSALKDSRLELPDPYYAIQPPPTPAPTPTLPTTVQTGAPPLKAAAVKTAAPRKTIIIKTEEEEPAIQTEEPKLEEAVQTPIQEETPTQTTSVPETNNPPVSSLPSLPPVPTFSTRIGSLGKAAGGRAASALGNTLERGYPALGRMGNRLLSGLEKLANPQGVQGSGRPGSLGSRLLNFGKGRALSISSVGSFAKKRGWMAFAGIIIGMFVLIGALAFVSSSETGEAAPLPGTVPVIPSADIAACKFIRSGDSTKELTYKSPLLLSYIQEASNLTDIPPAVFAAFIRVETPSTVTKNDDEIRNLPCAKSTTGALGVMQIQPKGTKGHDEGPVENGAGLIGKNYDELTDADYCDVRKNILMGAGFILKKMTYKTDNYPKTYGAGIKWDSTWTTDKEAIEKMVSSYYGCLRYGSSDDENNFCSDPGRIYSYGDDVWTSIQNCKPSSQSAPLPPTNDHADWIMKNFNIDITALSGNYPQWASEVLNMSLSTAPKFQDLIKTKPTKVLYSPEGGGSFTRNETVYLRVGLDAQYFKQIFIHELGHRIKGPAGVASPPCPSTGQRIEQLEIEEKYLTYYAENATPADVRTPACGPNDPATRTDEDFGETVSYYVNRDIKELNYGSECKTYNAGLNPYERTKREDRPVPRHKAYIQCLLGP